MSNRININKDASLKAMMALENYVTSSSLSKKHKELIKIRASQINGCAYCINMHTADARKYGETEQRIYALSAWRDTPYFDEQEEAILALTEELTFIQNHVTDETYNRAAALFNEAQLIEIYMSVITINAWNRVAIGTGMQPA